MRLPFHLVTLILFAVTATATPPPGHVHRPSDDKNPPSYRYGYEIGDVAGKESQGKVETRSGELASGRYYVNEEKSSTDVKYFADEWGYHPLVKYSAADDHSSATAHFALGEHVVKALLNGTEVGEEVKLPVEQRQSIQRNHQQPVRRRRPTQASQPYTPGPSVRDAGVSGSSSVAPPSQPIDDHEPSATASPVNLQLNYDLQRTLPRGSKFQDASTASTVSVLEENFNNYVTLPRTSANDRDHQRQSDVRPGYFSVGSTSASAPDYRSPTRASIYVTNPSTTGSPRAGLRVDSHQENHDSRQESTNDLFSTLSDDLLLVRNAGSFGRRLNPASHLANVIESVTQRHPADPPRRPRPYGSYSTSTTPRTSVSHPGDLEDRRRFSTTPTPDFHDLANSVSAETLSKEYKNSLIRESSVTGSYADILSKIFSNGPTEESPAGVSSSGNSRLVRYESNDGNATATHADRATTPGLSAYGKRRDHELYVTLRESLDSELRDLSRLYSSTPQTLSTFSSKPIVVAELLNYNRDKGFEYSTTFPCTDEDDRGTTVAGVSSTGESSVGFSDQILVTPKLQASSGPSPVQGVSSSTTAGEPIVDDRPRATPAPVKENIDGDGPNEGALVNFGASRINELEKLGNYERINPAFGQPSGSEVMDIAESMKFAGQIGGPDSRDQRIEIQKSVEIYQNSPVQEIHYPAEVISQVSGINHRVQQGDSVGAVRQGEEQSRSYVELQEAGNAKQSQQRYNGLHDQQRQSISGHTAFENGEGVRGTATVHRGNPVRADNELSDYGAEQRNAPVNDEAARGDHREIVKIISDGIPEMKQTPARAPQINVQVYGSAVGEGGNKGQGMETRQPEAGVPREQQMKAAPGMDEVQASKAQSQLQRILSESGGVQHYFSGAGWTRFQEQKQGNRQEQKQGNEQEEKEGNQQEQKQGNEQKEKQGNQQEGKQGQKQGYRQQQGLWQEVEPGHWKEQQLGNRQEKQQGLWQEVEPGHWKEQQLGNRQEKQQGLWQEVEPGHWKEQQLGNRQEKQQGLWQEVEPGHWKEQQLGNRQEKQQGLWQEVEPGHWKEQQLGNRQEKQQGPWQEVEPGHWKEQQLGNRQEKQKGPWQEVEPGHWKEQRMGNRQEKQKEPWQEVEPGHWKEQQLGNRQEKQEGPWQEVEPGHWKEQQLGNRQEKQQGLWQEVEPGHWKEQQLGNRQEKQQGLWQEVEPGHWKEQQLGNRQEKQQGLWQEVEPGHWKEQQLGNRQEKQQGLWQEVEPGHWKEQQLGNRQQQLQGHWQEVEPGHWKEQPQENRQEQQQGNRQEQQQTGNRQEKLQGQRQEPQQAQRQEMQQGNMPEQQQGNRPKQQQKNQQEQQQKNQQEQQQKNQQEQQQKNQQEQQQDSRKPEIPRPMPEAQQQQSIILPYDQYDSSDKNLQQNYGIAVQAITQSRQMAPVSYLPSPVAERIIHKTIHVPQPYPVEVPRIIEKKVPYPVEKIVERKVPYPVEKIVERKVPYPVEKIVEKKVPVPQPYPVHIQVPVDRIIEKQVLQPYPVHIEKIIEKKVPYPVQRLVPQPYPVHIIQPYPVEKIVEKPVHIPVTVEKIVEKKVHVPHPYPVQVPIKVPYPVEITKYVEQSVQVPYGVRYGVSYQQIMKPQSTNGLYGHQESTSLPVYGLSLVSNQHRDRANASHEFQGYTYGKPAIAFVTGRTESGNPQRSNGWEQFAYGKSSGSDNHHNQAFAKKSYVGQSSQLPQFIHNYPGSNKRHATYRQNNVAVAEKSAGKDEYVGPVPAAQQTQSQSGSKSHQKSRSRSSSDHQQTLLLQPVQQHSTSVTRTAPVSTSASSSRRARQQEENPTHYQSGPGAFRQSKIEYGFKPPMVPSIQYDEKTATKVEN